MKYTSRLKMVLLCLSFPAIATLLQPNLAGKPNIELRTLQNLPLVPNTLEEVRNWPQKFDQFTTDGFPLRGKMIGFASKFLYSFGLSISPEVFIGNERWLFLKRNSDVLDEFRGIRKLESKQVSDWADEYIRRKEVLASRGIKLLLVVAPNKHTIYPQFLHPWNFQIGETITDQVFSELRVRGIDGIIDLRSLLKMKSQSERVYGVNNTHWNDRGAYFAYQEIIKHLPGAHAVSAQNLVFERRQVFGDLSKLLGYADLTEDSLVLNMDDSNINFEFDPKTNKSQFSQEGWMTKTKLDAPRAIFLSDSFTYTYLYKYLAPSFSATLFKHHLGMRFNPALIDKFSPNYVVYVIAERLIPYKLGR